MAIIEHILQVLANGYFCTVANEHPVQLVFICISGTSPWRRSSEIISHQLKSTPKKKRSSLDVNVLASENVRTTNIFGQQQRHHNIIIPDIRTEQVFCSPEKLNNDQPKLLLSSPTPDKEAVLPQEPIIKNESKNPDKSRNPDEDCEKSSKKSRMNWRSQTAFELSSSMSCESEASFIINEFLHKTAKNSDSIDKESPTPSEQRKMESYV